MTIRGRISHRFKFCFFNIIFVNILVWTNILTITFNLISEYWICNVWNKHFVTIFASNFPEAIIFPKIFEYNIYFFHPSKDIWKIEFSIIEERANNSIIRYKLWIYEWIIERVGKLWVRDGAAGDHENLVGISGSSTGIYLAALQEITGSGVVTNVYVSELVPR